MHTYYWKKALRSGVGMVAGVLIANMADSPGIPLYSFTWFRHAGLVALTAFLVTELTYVKNYFGNGEHYEHKFNPGNNGTSNT